MTVFVPSVMQNRLSFFTGAYLSIFFYFCVAQASNMMGRKARLRASLLVEVTRPEERKKYFKKSVLEGATVV